MNIVHKKLIKTPLGPMLAIADDHELYLLDFIDRDDLAAEIYKLQQALHCDIETGDTCVLKQITFEMTNYFSGKNLTFTTPVALRGSAFQQKVWRQLSHIPHGTTQSYLDIAKAIRRPKAFRAVANANGANRLTILIPCHRVINHNGKLGGYGGGLARKQWLLEHERQFADAKY